MIVRMPRFGYVVLALTLIRIVINTMHRMVYPFLAVLARGMGVDIRLLSLGLSLRAAVQALAPILATISDSGGRKAGLRLGVAFFLLGVGLVVVFPSFITFIFALICTALSKSVFEPAMHAFLSDWVPYHRRGRAVGLIEFGWSLSLIVGVPLAGLLISRGGWRAPFPWFVLAGVVAWVGLTRLIPNDPAPREGSAKPLANLKAVFQESGAGSVLLVAMLMSGANELIALIFGVWLEDALGVQIGGLGLAAIAIGFAELGGESLVTGLTDRIGKLRSVAIGLLLNSLVALFLPFAGAGFVAALTGLIVFFLSFEFSVVSLIPVVSELQPMSRATLLAMIVAGISLGRSLAALVGTLLYAQGIGANSLSAVVLNLLAVLMLTRLRGKELQL